MDREILIFLTQIGSFVRKTNSDFLTNLKNLITTKKYHFIVHEFRNPNTGEEVVQVFDNSHYDRKSLAGKILGRIIHENYREKNLLKEMNSILNTIENLLLNSLNFKNWYHFLDLEDKGYITTDDIYLFFNRGKKFDYHTCEKILKFLKILHRVNDGETQGGYSPEKRIRNNTFSRAIECFVSHPRRINPQSDFNNFGQNAVVGATRWNQNTQKKPLMRDSSSGYYKFKRETQIKRSIDRKPRLTKYEITRYDNPVKVNRDHFNDGFWNMRTPKNSRDRSTIKDDDRRVIVRREVHVPRGEDFSRSRERSEIENYNQSCSKNYFKYANSDKETSLKKLRDEVSWKRLDELRKKNHDRDRRSNIEVSREHVERGELGNRHRHKNLEERSKSRNYTPNQNSGINGARYNFNYSKLSKDYKDDKKTPKNLDLTRQRDSSLSKNNLESSHEKPPIPNLNLQKVNNDSPQHVQKPEEKPVKTTSKLDCFQFQIQYTPIKPSSSTKTLNQSSTSKKLNENMNINIEKINPPVVGPSLLINSKYGFSSPVNQIKINHEEEEEESDSKVIESFVSDSELDNVELDKKKKKIEYIMKKKRKEGKKKVKDGSVKGSDLIESSYVFYNKDKSGEDKLKSKEVKTSSEEEEERLENPKNNYETKNVFKNLWEGKVDSEDLESRRTNQDREFDKESSKRLRKDQSRKLLKNTEKKNKGRENDVSSPEEDNKYNKLLFSGKIFKTEEQRNQNSRKKNKKISLLSKELSDLNPSRLSSEIPRNENLEEEWVNDDTETDQPYNNFLKHNNEILKNNESEFVTDYSELSENDLKTESSRFKKNRKSMEKAINDEDVRLNTIPELKTPISSEKGSNKNSQKSIPEEKKKLKRPKSILKIKKNPNFKSEKELLISMSNSENSGRESVEFITSSRNSKREGRSPKKELIDKEGNLLVESIPVENQENLEKKVIDLSSLQYSNKTPTERTVVNIQSEENNTEIPLSKDLLESHEFNLTDHFLKKNIENKVEEIKGTDGRVEENSQGKKEEDEEFNESNFEKRRTLVKEINESNYDTIKGEKKSVIASEDDNEITENEVVKNIEKESLEIAKSKSGDEERRREKRMEIKKIEDIEESDDQSDYSELGGRRGDLEKEKVKIDKRKKLLKFDSSFNSEKLDRENEKEIPEIYKSKSVGILQNPAIETKDQELKTEENIPESEENIVQSRNFQKKKSEIKDINIGRESEYLSEKTAKEVKLTVNPSSTFNQSEPQFLKNESTNSISSNSSSLTQNSTKKASIIKQSPTKDSPNSGLKSKISNSETREIQNSPSKLTEETSSDNKTLNLMNLALYSEDSPERRYTLNSTQKGDNDVNSRQTSVEKSRSEKKDLDSKKYSIVKTDGIFDKNTEKLGKNDKNENSRKSLENEKKVKKIKKIGEIDTDKIKSNPYLNVDNEDQEQLSTLRKSKGVIHPPVITKDFKIDNSEENQKTPLKSEKKKIKNSPDVKTVSILESENENEKEENLKLEKVSCKKLEENNIKSEKSDENLEEDLEKNIQDIFNSEKFNSFDEEKNYDDENMTSPKNDTSFTEITTNKNENVNPLKQSLVKTSPDSQSFKKDPRGMKRLDSMETLKQNQELKKPNSENLRNEEENFIQEEEERELELDLGKKKKSTPRVTYYSGTDNSIIENFISENNFNKKENEEDKEENKLNGKKVKTFKKEENIEDLYYSKDPTIDIENKSAPEFIKNSSINEEDEDLYKISSNSTDGIKDIKNSSNFKNSIKPKEKKEKVTKLNSRKTIETQEKNIGDNNLLSQKSSKKLIQIQKNKPKMKRPPKFDKDFKTQRTFDKTNKSKNSTLLTTERRNNKNNQSPFKQTESPDFNNPSPPTKTKPNIQKQRSNPSLLKTENKIFKEEEISDIKTNPEKKLRDSSLNNSSYDNNSSRSPSPNNERFDKIDLAKLLQSEFPPVNPPPLASIYRFFSILDYKRKGRIRTKEIRKFMNSMNLSLGRNEAQEILEKFGEKKRVNFEIFNDKLREKRKGSSRGLDSKRDGFSEVDQNLFSFSNLSNQPISFKNDNFNNTTQKIPEIEIKNSKEKNQVEKKEDKNSKKDLKIENIVTRKNSPKELKKDTSNETLNRNIPRTPSSFAKITKTHSRENLNSKKRASRNQTPSRRNRSISRNQKENLLKRSTRRSTSARRKRSPTKSPVYKSGQLINGIYYFNDDVKFVGGFKIYRVQDKNEIVPGRLINSIGKEVNLSKYWFLREGKGVIKLNNRDSIQGNWVEDKLEGKAVLTMEEPVSPSNKNKAFKENCKKEAVFFKNGVIEDFEEFKIQRRVSNGDYIVLSKEGFIYIGECFELLKHGSGILYYPKSAQYSEKIFKKLKKTENPKIENIKEIIPDLNSLKKCYEGEYKFGREHGKGVQYDLEGNIEYKGQFKEGLRSGWGAVFRSEFGGEIIKEFEGEFLLGEPAGNNLIGGVNVIVGNEIYDFKFDEFMEEGDGEDQIGSDFDEEYENDDMEFFGKYRQ